MRRSLLRMVALFAAVLWANPAAALGLGEIDVHSRLNQRFSATIPILAATPEELAALKVSLAGNAEFERAGLERPVYLSTLRFDVVTQGQPRIEVRSDQIAREPFLTLLLDLREPAGRLVREYTVLLDPPDYTAPTSAAPEFYQTAPESTQRTQTVSPPAGQRQSAPAQRAEPAVAPEQPATAERPATVERPATSAVPAQGAEPAQAASPAAADEGGRYGPVRGDETLWSIATRLRPAGATMDQILLALYTANPRAFDGGINGLLKGAELRVPPAAEVTAVGPAEARAEVMRLRGMPAPGPRTAPPASTPAPAATTTPSTPIILPSTRPGERPAELPPPSEPANEPARTPSEAPPVEAPAEIPAETPAESPADLPATPPAGAEAPDADVDALGGTLTPEPGAGPAFEDEVEAAPDAALEAPASAAAEQAITPPDEAPIVTDAPPREPLVEERGLLETLLLPLIMGLLVLGGLGFLISRLLARRKAAAPATVGATPRPNRLPPPKPAVVAKPAAAAAAAPSVEDELDALQATLDRAAERDAGAAAGDTQQLRTQQIPAQPAAPPTPASAAPAAAAEPVDFDLTGQFESQTVQINLDANDPVSEADFHLAYGLYDEAALLLRQAAEQQPERADIRIKLAETYFAAGKADEFVAAAEAARPMLSPGDWQKIAIMGQQLAPDSPSFRQQDVAAPIDSGDIDLDLGLGDDAPQPAPPQPAAQPEMTAAPAAEPAGLDFKLDELEIPAVESPQLDLAADKGDALEFDLSQFDLAGSEEPQDPATTPAAAPALRPADEGGLDFELDLSGFEVAAPEAPQPSAAPQPAGPAAAESTRARADVDAHPDGDIRLDDIDLGNMSVDPADLAAGDEAATKLDLARAYVDMGDQEMARSLLDEVMEQGSAQQKQEAAALIERLV